MIYPLTTSNSPIALRHQKPLVQAVHGALLCMVLITLASTEATAQSVLPEVKVIGERDANNAYQVKRSVAGTKTDTPLVNIPQSISVITRKAIEDLSMQNLGDAVRYVPGVGTAQGEGNRETLVFRGNSTTSDFYLDGMRDDVQYYRDLYNIQQVEVLKGPNGMMFGRGGAGGVINRVSKEANWDTLREVSLQAGSYDNKRIAVDLNQAINETAAFRINGMFEDSESYRDGVFLKRYGINPTLTLRPGRDTKVVLGAEYFHDERIGDRGVSSFRGRPLDTDPSTFFGNPEQSPTDTTVKAFTAAVEHKFSNNLTLRNHTRYADYDKFYQNVFPGAVSADGSTVSISSYNNATQRENLFNQTDLTYITNTGSIKHTFLAGMELGRQESENFRNTGYFGAPDSNTRNVTVPVANPRSTTPVFFRQSATDANNQGTAKVAAVYFQDQIEFSPKWQSILGVRYDKFEVDFRNNRTGANFNTSDDLVSPRAGLIYKPIESLSLYTSYSLSYVPRAGEQLSSLNLNNESLDPEKFVNKEIGAKWDVRPDLSFSAAVYELTRKNVAVADPNDPTVSTLVDGQRTKGFELGVSGNITRAWSVFGGYAYQDGEVTSNQSATIRDGARLANLPKNTFSLWNRYDFSPQWGFGLGVIKQSSYLAGLENTVAPASNVNVPGFTRVDGAVYYKVNNSVRVQLNVQNIFDKEYYQFANSNNNITPGSPRSARVSMVASF